MLSKEVARMTLLELCDPLFAYVCRLNQAGRNGATDFDFIRVRREVTDIFKDLRSKASANAALIGQYEKTEPALIFFVDFIIASSPMPIAPEWQDPPVAFGRDPPRIGGDSQFFLAVHRATAGRLA